MEIEPYFRDLDLWVCGEHEFMTKIKEYCHTLETSDEKGSCPRLWRVIGQLGDTIFFNFLGKRSSLLYQPCFGSVDGGDDREELMKKYEHYAMDSFITKRTSETPNVFMIVHFHARGGLEAVEYLQRAESFLEEKLRQWIGTAEKGVYGIIFIGGKMTMYYMDMATKTLWRLNYGELYSAQSPPERHLWHPVVDKERLVYLLQIFQEEWYRTNEKSFKEELKRLLIKQDAALLGRRNNDVDILKKVPSSGDESESSKENSQKKANDFL